MTARRSLLELLSAAGLPTGGACDAGVTGVCSDSRRVDDGWLFVAVPGTHDDGARFVPAALAAGASAVVAPVGAGLDELPVPLVRVADARAAVAALAATFHGDPSASMTTVGVTGTNGKTTTAHVVRAVLDHAGRGPCALFGTIAHEWPGTRVPAANTTPGADELQEMLARARDAGSRAAVLEVSSHALAQRRTDRLRCDAAVFTNLSGDHLDYHGTVEDYAEAKARLFRTLEKDAVAAVNVEDAHAPTMLRGVVARVVRYGIDAPSRPDVTAGELRLDQDGSSFVLRTPDGSAPVRTALRGRYNAMNLLGAAAALHGLGVGTDDIAAGLSSVPGVPGRLEAVECGQPFTVLVDYAHTDDAVANVLRNLRRVVTGRVISVVGCGGDRDRTKRPRMARAAAELSDTAWFTSDNPRTESPPQIIRDMLDGVHGARNVRVEVDRRAAIGRAVAAARVGDCVAILGKGHEDYQVLGTEKVAFDDRVVAAEAIRAAMERLACEAGGSRGESAPDGTLRTGPEGTR